METLQPNIDGMAYQIKLAIQEDKVYRVEDYPREAFIQAAWQGIALYHIELATRGNALKVRQFELEKNARLDLLTDEEREQAVNLANDWLDEHFDK